MEIALAAALTGFPTDTEEVVAARELLRRLPVLVFDLALACPVMAEPPTDRDVPAFRDLFSCANHCLLD